jgi:solute carrier family 25 S-adenosylmethionine transporter 26
MTELELPVTLTTTTTGLSGGKLTYLIAGGCAGLSVDVVLFPLDTLKTRMQSKGGLIANGGFLNIYAGLSSAALGSVPSASLFFLTYESLKEKLAGNVYFSAPINHCIAAGGGELMACLVRVPTENTKQKVQAGMYSSAKESFLSIYRTLGIRGFYVGYGTTIARELPFSFIQYPLYEKLKSLYKNHRNTEPLPWHCAMIGSFTGCIAAAATTPLDVVKTRMMLYQTSPTSKDGIPTIRPSILGTLQELYVEGGVKRLFAGIGPRVMWISLGGAVFFGAYETSKSLLDKLRHQPS